MNYTDDNFYEHILITGNWEATEISIKLANWKCPKYYNWLFIKITVTSLLNSVYRLYF